MRLCLRSKTIVQLTAEENAFKESISRDINGKYVVRCAIWYHMYNLNNVKNTHGGVLILIKLQAAQRITYML